MSLHARVVVRRPSHVLDVTLDVAPGEVVAVVGPNGAGKSTLIRAISGLVGIDDGEIRLGDTTWERGTTRLEARHRRVGMVFQQHLLFPHLSALDNAAFGPRSRGVRRVPAREAAQVWLDRLGIGEYAARRPHQLSGGQAQRVAIARALATDPDVLLLDEPLSALDVGVAMALRVELATHLRQFEGATVLVTHNALDALMLADRVLVLEDGAVAQEGPPELVARQPRTPHVARLLGVNMLRGTSAGTDVRLDAGGTLVTATPLHDEVHACFSPAAVTLTTSAPDGSARNVWAGTVMSAIPHGAAVRVHLDAVGGLIADVTPESAARLALAPGVRVWATVKATEVEVYAAHGPQTEQGNTRGIASR